MRPWKSPCSCPLFYMRKWGSEGARSSEQTAVSASLVMALSTAPYSLRAFAFAVPFAWNALPEPYLHSIFLHLLRSWSKHLSEPFFVYPIFKLHSFTCFPLLCYIFLTEQSPANIFYNLLSHVPHKEISVNDGQLIYQLSYEIIKKLENSYYPVI